jgi:micrococcal nuclease
MRNYYAVLFLLIFILSIVVLIVDFGHTHPEDEVSTKLSSLEKKESVFGEDGVPKNELLENDSRPMSQEVVTDIVDIFPLSQTEMYTSDNALSTSSRMFQVTKVIDGDTIEVSTEAGVRRVRYIGIDTPETVHPSRQVECFGREASAKNKELVEGKWVRLERDISDIDRYGRWLRYVYVDDVFVNYLLVADGYAKVFTYPPDVTYSNNFLQAERQARSQGLGMWGDVCGQWVSSLVEEGILTASQIASQKNCDIKGNINSQGERIYHLPRCQSYTQTLITPETGERWFCTESDAITAGWRKANNCP